MFVVDIQSSLLLYLMSLSSAGRSASSRKGLSLEERGLTEPVERVFKVASGSAETNLRWQSWKKLKKQSWKKPS